MDLSKRYTYVLTTGGIGPTHDDITAKSISQAFKKKYVFNKAEIQDWLRKDVREGPNDHVVCDYMKKKYNCDNRQREYVITNLAWKPIYQDPAERIDVR